MNESGMRLFESGDVEVPLPGMPDPRPPQPGLVGRDHPATSKSAAELVAPRSGTQRWRILELFVEQPYGLTADEVAYILDMPPQTVTPRMLELRNDETVGGWLVDTGFTRRTRYGREATVWELADGARRRFRQLASA